jgi:transposase-like protein
MAYSPERKEQVLKRMLHEPSLSIIALAQQTGISESTLNRWRHTLLPPGSTMTRDFKTAQDKAHLLFESSSLTDEQLGPFLRLHGICEADLLMWKQALLQALDQPGEPSSKRELRELKAKNKALERELARKEKALAEAAALLVLKKKLHQIWGDEDTNT